MPGRDHLTELSLVARRAAEALADDVDRLAATTWRTLRSGGRLFFCGNGGSAADAQHLAAEYIVRFARDGEPLAALALTTDSSVLTAAANDLGYEHVFARQVRALAREGDLLFLHSTSGNSRNLLQAVDAARAMGVTTVALLARGGGALAGVVDEAIVVPTDSTARAQEIHLCIGHAICDAVEQRARGDGSRADAVNDAATGRPDGDAPHDVPGPAPATGRRVSWLERLQEGRRREKEQTVFYRALASAAEDAGDASEAERLNELHADEQHHLSRLTARLLEMGGTPADLRAVQVEAPALDGWTSVARERERAEVAWYEALLGEGPDAATADVLEEILESERMHAQELGGKWMSA